MKQVATVRLDSKYAVRVIALGAVLTLAVVAQGLLISGGFSASDGFYYLFATALAIALHEPLHAVAMKLLRVKAKVSLVKAHGVPIALATAYSKIGVRDYVIATLAPQAISALLLSLALSLRSLALFLSYAIHVVSSSCDFYNILFTLIKAKTLSGFWIAEGGEYKLYINEA